jgi:hypothetical protein
MFLYQYVLPPHNCVHQSSSMTKMNNITHYNNNLLHYDNNNNNNYAQQNPVLQVFNLRDLYMMIALYL